MNVLIVGSGGREHALAWRIAQSPRLTRLFCAPGNGGTAGVAENVEVPPTDLAALADFAVQQRIELTVVGPEQPLAAGIVDLFESRGLRIVGPTRAAARLEADKAYAKQLMRRFAIPTAEARIFTDYQDARNYVASRDAGVVVKAAGLAQGKGVVLCEDPADAIIWLERIMQERLFGDAGRTVLVEEYLTGQEISVLCLVDGRNLFVLETSQDYKPLEDGDTGPNTGGMGAYSPVPFVSDEMLSRIEREILVPIVMAQHSEGNPFRGVLYAGLMITPGGPKVLEFNCRFGDPETQPLLRRLRSDLLDVFDALLLGKLDEITLDWDPRPAVGVVLAAPGYPGDYARGVPLRGLDRAAEVPEVVVFHSGTARNAAGELVSFGGRVLCVTGMGDSPADARARAYAAVERIDFPGAVFRRDIAGPDRPTHRPGLALHAGRPARR